MKHRQYYMQKGSPRFGEAGFTLIEIIVIMAILTVLFGFITLNLLNIKQKSSFNSSVTLLVSDLRTQQTKAMSFDTEGQSTTTSDYGVHFEQASYTLFRGSTYVLGNSGNFVVNLGDSVEFSSISLPSSVIVFLRQSGEILGYDASQNSVVIKNTQNNQQKTIQINIYGVVTQAN